MEPVRDRSPTKTGTSPKPAGGTVVTTRIAPNILESVYVGRMTADLVGVVRNQLKPLLDDGRATHWLINLDRVTSVELAPSDDASGFLAWFRSKGGKGIALVIPSSMVRMVVSALVFATGASVRVFETRPLALENLRQLPTT